MGSDVSRSRVRSLNYFVKTPKLLHSLYRDAVWFLSNSKQQIFLTFDDGPVEGITSKCLDILADQNVKATFFCVGENMSKNPGLLSRITAEGHQIGHHSDNHLNGWKSSNEEYFANVHAAAQKCNSTLFRPPYGKIKRSQLAELKRHYKVIMWDVLSGDFDPKSSEEKCISNVVDNTRSGSIIVMHDNEKCGAKMLACLPEIIKQLKLKGYSFEVLSS